MIRFACKDLDAWLKHPNRKPMVLRGARQVGKTWLVRNLADRNNLQLVELNFERSPELIDLFSDNNPEEILRNIEAALSIAIDRKSCLLFLDEVQATPRIFVKLRWFREEIPELPLIAAGSLLEFALKTLSYSMPVGRITFFYLEQISFLEFVLATGNDALLNKLKAYSIQSLLPDALHEKCLQLYRDYCIVGGMPEEFDDTSIAMPSEIRMVAGTVQRAKIRLFQSALRKAGSSSSQR